MISHCFWGSRGVQPGRWALRVRLAPWLKMKERPAAGKSHPLLYLPVSEVPLFPAHTPCLLFNQRECTHQPCSHPQWYSLWFFLPLLKINPLSEEGDTLLFDHSLTCSFNTTAIYWGPLGSALETQTWKGHRTHSSVQPTLRSTTTMESECCREEHSECTGNPCVYSVESGKPSQWRKHWAKVKRWAEVCQAVECVGLGESIPDGWGSLGVSVSILLIVRDRNNADRLRF